MGCYEFGAEPYVSSGEEVVVLDDIDLYNYPNPFNPSGAGRSPSTTISFNIPETGDIKLEVFNIKGQKVKTLIDCYSAPGKYEVIWDGKDDNGKQVSSGVYFYKMKAGDYTSVRKMLLMK